MKPLSELLDRRAALIAQKLGLDQARVRRVLAKCVRTPKGDHISEEMLVDPQQRSVIFWPDLLEAMKYARPEVVLDFLDTEDPDLVAGRVAMAHVWASPEANLFRIRELATIAAGQMIYLNGNRDRLLAIGFPETVNPDESSWIARRLLNLYPIKRPLRDVPYVDPRGIYKFEYVWKATNQAVQWIRDVAYLIDETGRVLTTRPAPLCPYREAPLLPDLAPEDASRLESLREQVLNIKASAFKAACAAAQNESADELWPRFQEKLRATLSTDEIKFLLRMDLFYVGYDLISGRDEHRDVDVEPGGLTEIFQLVGLYEQAVASRIMEPIRDYLDPSGLVRRDPLGNYRTVIRSYYALIGRSERIAFDQAVESYKIGADVCEAMGTAFRQRLRDLIADSELAEMIIRRLVAPEIKEKLTQLIEGVADFQIGHHAATGMLAPLGISAVNSGESEPNVFQQEGDLWRVRFQNRPTYLKDGIGTQCLYHLLSAPGREIHSLDLIRRAKGVVVPAPDEEAASVTEEQRNAEGSHSTDLGDAGEMLDDDTRARYIAERERLDGRKRSAIARGDATAAAREQVSIDAINKELRRATDLAGRTRRAGSAAERARVTVQKHIAKSKRELEKKHPALYEHLESFLDTGTFCIYRPNPPITWN